jgi:hypothetical protein
MLAPRRFPTAMSGRSWSRALVLLKSSGRLVVAATRNSPTRLRPIRVFSANTSP